MMQQRRQLCAWEDGQMDSVCVVLSTAGDGERAVSVETAGPSLMGCAAEKERNEKEGTHIRVTEKMTQKLVMP